MLDDQTMTERQKVGQPGACINCHSSVVEAYVKLGRGEFVAGFEKLNAMPFFEARKEVKHPIGCIDCHDPGTMALRITRPAFMDGIATL